ncbi:MAG: alpha-L-fucosidase [Chitinophagaceae bacterium]|nr:alpha-L-fucosidase [Chitinophagaceae bacterium]
MKKLAFLLIIIIHSRFLPAQKLGIPVPTKHQLMWHEMEYYFFIHFGPNTFTDKEWGHGDEPEDIFNPSALDCRQWVRVAKAAGAKGIIITAKHHDGFCLWPSNYSAHTVRESKWNNGKGDVLQELSQACKEGGLKFGVYISPWDKNHPDYGTEKYNEVFVNMMKEIFTNYGPIWELWWDGANGEGPNGKKQVYDWSRFKETVKKLSPNTVVFSDVGPHIRWVGNEKGVAGETNWNNLDTVGFTPGLGAPSIDTLNKGNMNGKAWIPAECDVSIRPGWFWHENENSKGKNQNELFNLYLKSVGRGSNLLLNVPPDRRGLIHENDSAALVEFRLLRDENFATNKARQGTGYYIPHRGTRKAPAINDGTILTYETISLTHLQSMGIEFATEQKINCIVLREDLSKGQACAGFRLLLMNKKHELVSEIKGTTIGRKRIITFPETEVGIIGLVIDNQKMPTRITEVEAYLIDGTLIEKQ